VAPAAGRTTIADPAGGRMTATDPADGGRTAVGRMAAEAKAGAVAKGGLELASGSAGTGDARRHEEGDG
jgi:hypothetical protein